MTERERIARRAIEMLGVAAKHARQTSDYAPDNADIVHYDDVDCDGLCIADDCEAAAEELAILASQPDIGKVVEVLENLLDRIHRNGGLGPYNGGPAFVIEPARQLLSELKTRIGETGGEG